MMMMQRSNQFLNRRKMDFKISLNCVRRFVSFLQASQHGKHQAEQSRRRARPSHAIAVLCTVETWHEKNVQQRCFILFYFIYFFFLFMLCSITISV
jgi:hypothetical protein